MTELKALAANIRTHMNDIADEILTNRLPLDEYRRLQGVIEGLAWAEREALDLDKLQNQDD